MQALRKVASALSFAHLAGLGRVVKASAEDDKPDDEDKKAAKAKAKAEDESQDEDSKRADADDKPDEGDEDDKKSKASAEDDNSVDEDEDDKKAKAKADDSDDSEEEMSGKSSAGAARLREQARCAAIFASPAAARNPVLAANLAFTTRMSRADALNLLEKTPGAAAPALPGNAARSAARNPNLGTGGAPSRSSAETVAKSWDAAFAKASPRRA